MGIDRLQVVELHQSGLNQAQIARMLDCTRSYISLILRNSGYPGRVQRVPVRLGKFVTDEELIVAGYPTSFAKDFRKKNVGRRRPPVDRVSRRQNLVSYLFGDEVEPGPNFILFLESLLPRLSSRRAQLIKEFYIDGLEFEPGITTDLTYRVSARRELKKLVDDSGVSWEEEGIIER